MTAVRVYTDGGARGNPGPAAVGVVIEAESGQPIHSFGRAIGTATNNVAEYLAVIGALEWLVSQPRITKVGFFLDSALVVHQLRGEWKLKQEHLRPLAVRIRELAKNLTVSFSLIPRTLNRRADALVNRALDKC